MIIQTNTLTSEHVDEVKRLAEVCKIHDKNGIPIYAHLLDKDRIYPSSILYYQNDCLLGFLSAFFFKRQECEVSVLVEPEHRQQGIAKKMLQEIFPLFLEHFIETLTFSVPHDFFKQSLEENFFTFSRSEYDMERHSEDKLTLQKKHLKLVMAKQRDLPFLLKLDSLCFNNGLPGSTSRMQSILDDKNYQILMLSFRNVLIGKAHLHYLDDIVRLTDISILPKEQGKGYGSELLKLLINYLLLNKKADILLEVEAKNKHALQLYTKVGFSVTNVYDFWSIATNNLGKIISMQ